MRWRTSGLHRTDRHGIELWRRESSRLVAIAALSGSEVVEETFTKIVESQGLTRPGGSLQARARFLMEACYKVSDGYVIRNARLTAATDSPGSSLQCWTPLESESNRTAVIRVAKDRNGKYGGCLETDSSRYQSEGS